MIIGRFAENQTGGVFIGHIRTLFLKSDKVIFEPIAAPSTGDGRQPSHRIRIADDVDVGAAWKRTAKAHSGVYYDVQLEDPTFAAPIQARLVRARTKAAGYMLLWERPGRKARPAA